MVLSVRRSVAYECPKLYREADDSRKARQQLEERIQNLEAELAEVRYA